MDSVYNLQNKKSNLLCDMFLDPDNNGVTIARYDELRYPRLEQLTEQQLAFFWRPQEVDISKDKSDFQSLKEHEKHIFTSNLKRQILLDSIQGRSPNLIFLPICTVPELEVWLETWAFSETIHSKAYTHLIRNVYPNPSVVFDEINDIKEIVECANDITKHYDFLLQYNLEVALNGYVNSSRLKHKRLVWKALNAANILEGIRFYVSFACSWAFAEQKKMEGNAKIIKFICLDDQSEILTDSGFKLLSEFNIDSDKVAQYTKNRMIEFVQAERFIQQEYSGKMVHLKSDRVDCMMTPDHRVIYREDNQIKELKASEFIPYSEINYINAGLISGGNVSEVSALDKFKIICSLTPRTYSNQHPDYFNLVLNFTSQSRFLKVVDLCNELSFDYEIEEYNNVYKVIVILSNEFKLYIADFSWVNLLENTSTYFLNFLQEVCFWTKKINNPRFPDNLILYSTKNRKNADIMQQIATLAGCSSMLYDSNPTKLSLSIYLDRDYERADTSHNERKEVDYVGKVYCVTVPSQMFISRRNGAVIVTGNCRDENLHLGSTQYLINQLPKDDPDFKQIKKETEQECIDMFVIASEQEKDWAKYLFKNGSMIGLNEKLLVQYVEWIASKRMSAVGLSCPYTVEKSNPLPWTESWIAGRERQVAPQETEISSYLVGDINKDLDSDFLQGLSI